MDKIGVLALQGGVDEHIHALLRASEKSSFPIRVAEVRCPEDLAGMDGLIIPGGESTTICRLMERAGIFEQVKAVRKIMGTCAGAIILAKEVDGAKADQRFLSLMDIRMERNAYGSQAASFETQITTVFGTLNGVFIRAPRLHIESKEVQPMAFRGEEVVGAYQKTKAPGAAHLPQANREGERHFLALAFHPELTTTKFHEFFIKL